MSGHLIRRLIDAGVDPVEAGEIIAEAMVLGAQAGSKEPSPGALRQRRYVARKQASLNVIKRHKASLMTENDAEQERVSLPPTPPTLPKEPQPVKENPPKGGQKKKPLPQKHEFEQWYADYPHKVGRGHAERAFKTARNKANLAELQTGLQNYIRSKPPDIRWANPATWLNGERWKDEPAEVQNGQDELETERQAARERLRESQRRHREELQANGVGLHEGKADIEGPAWDFD